MIQEIDDLPESDYFRVDYDVENLYFKPELIKLVKEELVEYNLSELEIKAYIISFISSIYYVEVSNKLFTRYFSAINTTLCREVLFYSDVMPKKEGKEADSILSKTEDFSEQRIIERAKEGVEEYFKEEKEFMEYQKIAETLKKTISPSKRKEIKKILAEIPSSIKEFPNGYISIYYKIEKGLSTLRTGEFPSYLALFGPNLDKLDNESKNRLENIITTLRTCRGIAFKLNIEENINPKLNKLIQETIQNINLDNKIDILNELLCTCSKILIELENKYALETETAIKELTTLKVPPLNEREESYHKNIIKAFLESSQYQEEINDLKQKLEILGNNVEEEITKITSQIQNNPDSHQAISYYWEYYSTIIKQYNELMLNNKEEHERILIRNTIFK